MATLAERAKQAEEKTKEKEEQIRTEQEEYSRKYKAESPKRALANFNAKWPEIERKILEAAAKKEHSYSWYFSYWNYQEELSDEQNEFIKLVREAATGMTVMVETKCEAGADPRSGGLDGPQGPTETTWSHTIYFDWY